MYNKVILSALLHDIGKLIQRAEGFTQNHAKTGVDYLNNCSNELFKTKEITDAVRYHHAKDLVNSNLGCSEIAYIVYEADNISSGTDRREDLEKEIEEEKTKWNNFQKDVCLSSVFNKIKEKKDYAYLLRDLSDHSPNYPFEEGHDIKATQNKYLDLKAQIDKSINEIKNPNSLLQLFEATMSFIPSSTNTKEVTDISLYDHSKLTAAIASCIYEYFKANNITDYKEYCFNLNTINEHRNEKYYKLVSFDLSGIQNFIYTIASEQALKSLRARSFYLEFIMEHMQDELLEGLHLSRANILYSGGGHSYLLLPNTQMTCDILNKLQTKINNWFTDKFSIDLYLAYAEVECSSNDLKNSTNNIFKSISEKLSEAKLQRYNTEQLKKLFNVEENKKTFMETERECKICKTSAKELSETKDICELCESLIKLGEYLVKRNENKKYGIIVTDEKVKYSIELPTITDKKKYFKIIGDDTLPQNNEKVYSINNYSQSNYDYSTNIWVGDYCYKENGQNYDFSDFAQSSTGIKRLGVMRCDVDNLGSTFSNGFGENYSTISRYATLSRTLNMFYKYYINALCKDKKIAIVYSGGDDVFVVGAWSDVLIFAKELKEAFVKYTCKTLTLSGGIGFFSPSYPIYKMAEATGTLEDFAKKNNNNEKNSIALFGENRTLKSDDRTKTEQFVFTWDEFNEILEKQKIIKDICYFDENKKEEGKVFLSVAFIYRLMSLINSEDKKISLARFAYTLGRMEAKNNDEVLKSKFGTVKTMLYKMYSEDKKQLLTILNLIVYENRKQEK